MNFKILQDFVYDSVDLVGNQFPDFFKLRPDDALEPDLSFLTGTEQVKFEFEHDHAKREQPQQNLGIVLFTFYYVKR